jgi:hypothetical protein
MKVNDYTRLQIGEKIDNGEIQICPHCGKNGLAEQVNGKMFFTHFQAVGFNDSSGQPEMKWEWCPHPATTK